MLLQSNLSGNCPPCPLKAGQGVVVKSGRSIWEQAACSLERLCWDPWKPHLVGRESQGCQGEPRKLVEWFGTVILGQGLRPGWDGAREASSRESSGVTMWGSRGDSVHCRHLCAPARPICLTPAGQSCCDSVLALTCVTSGNQPQAETEGHSHCQAGHASKTVRRSEKEFGASRAAAHLCGGLEPVCLRSAWSWSGCRG